MKHKVCPLYKYYNSKFRLYGDDFVLFNVPGFLFLLNMHINKIYM